MSDMVGDVVGDTVSGVDGDIIGVTVDTPRSDAAVAMYDALGPALREGDEPVYGLRSMLDTIGHGLEPVESLVRDRPGTPGWAAAGDITRTPFLGWLMQWVGVPYRPDMTTAQNRARAMSRPQSKRGTPSYLRAVAREYLIAAGRVEIFERDGGSRRVRIRVYRSEVLDEARLRAAASAAVPWTFTATVEVVVGWTLQQVADAYPTGTLADVAADYPTLSDLASHLPEA